ncbi:MAG: sulfide/dihydroorotate dehydrogenase-like FAD/NAD-binding protein [Firmicutes bacterium]|nr:sulfide/dihydroorotate dehydrogenase-like FAD/NAD-binding protein [Bacillota bacterium]
MYPITEKKVLNENTVYIRIKAPLIAAKGKPGQFVIIRLEETGERVPFTLADFGSPDGTIALIFQIVGLTTMKLAKLEVGDDILDVTGPLGNASELSGYKKAAVVAGGLGCAICYPQAKYLKSLGTKVDIIAGFRNEGLIILKDEMTQASDRLVIMTDDGSNGNKGLVTEGLKKLIEDGADYDLVIAIGPPIMMKFVCALTKEYNIKTIVSLNPIMIDGTGMCGGCRVTVGGKLKFACVDGPDFDGHEVDFDELIRRNRSYREQEEHKCRLFREANHNG